MNLWWEKCARRGVRAFNLTKTNRETTMKIFAASSLYEASPNNPVTNRSVPALSRRAGQRSSKTLVMRPNEQGTLQTVAVGRVRGKLPEGFIDAQRVADLRFTRA